MSRPLAARLGVDLLEQRSRWIVVLQQVVELEQRRGVGGAADKAANLER